MPTHLGIVSKQRSYFDMYPGTVEIIDALKVWVEKPENFEAFPLIVVAALKNAHIAQCAPAMDIGGRKFAY